MEDSPVRYSLGQNRLFCAQLNYEDISSYLLAKSALTELEYEQIRLKTEDAVERMNELISLLSTLNSAEKFHAFREAVRASGELDLEKILLHHYNLILTKVKTEDAPKCVFIPVILQNIFSHLDGADLRNARRVCTIWNNTVTNSYSHRFTLKVSDQKQMCEFMRTAPTSELCKKINNFTFCTKDSEPSGGWIFYRTFFAEFGAKILSLELGDGLNENLVCLILSSDIQMHLRNVKRLKMEAFMHSSLIPANETFSFLGNVENLELVEPSNEDGFQRLIWFLRTCQRWLPNLKSFSLKWTRAKNSTMPSFPPHFTKLIFEKWKIEVFEIIGKWRLYLSDDCLKSMTTPDGQESALRSATLPFRQISAQVFHDFLHSHRHTLTCLELNFCQVGTSLDLMNGIPSLDCVKQLGLHVRTTAVSHGGWNVFSSLSFVNKLPALRLLRISGLGHDEMEPISNETVQFQHFGLRHLEVDFMESAYGNGNWILAFILYVQGSFPNLIALEIDIESVDVTWAWPLAVGRLKLQTPQTWRIQNNVRWAAAELDS